MRKIFFLFVRSYRDDPNFIRHVPSSHMSRDCELTRISGLIRDSEFRLNIYEMLSQFAL